MASSSIKTDGSGDYESMMDVHTEMKSILQPSCIPQVQGATWGGKVVKRKYAFGDAEAPREEQQYLKVVYNAKYPKPDREKCLGNTGKFIHKIFGVGASVLENFILKRKLMGPSWIRIYNVEPNTVKSSWCKVEVVVNNPKDVIRYDLVSVGEKLEGRPSPPVVSVSLKLKTVVHPKSHKSEIVSLSAICHKRVLLDSRSDESTIHMTHLSLIRPLGLLAKASGQAFSEFPRDIDDQILKEMPQLQKTTNERHMLNNFLLSLEFGILT